MGRIKLMMYKLQTKVTVQIILFTSNPRYEYDSISNETKIQEIW